MFGYIKPYKPELKIKDFEIYKGVYCGLCKKLAKEYGPFARMTLSYDFTFLAMIKLAIAKECKGFSKKSCIYNPLKRKTCINPCDDMTFISTLAMIMLYYKLKDNCADSKGFKKIGAILLKFIFTLSYKKAKKLEPYMDEQIGNAMKAQAMIEKENCDSIDRASDSTARALGVIFETLSYDESQKLVLSKLGFLIGRWVYLIDALDDLESDVKQGTYNPFACKFVLSKDSTKEQIDLAREYAIGTINLTAGELSNTYELLEIQRYKDILDNIIYLGLPQAKQEALQKSKNKENINEGQL